MLRHLCITIFTDMPSLSQGSPIICCGFHIYNLELQVYHLYVKTTKRKKMPAMVDTLDSNNHQHALLFQGFCGSQANVCMPQLIFFAVFSDNLVQSCGSVSYQQTHRIYNKMPCLATCLKWHHSWIHGFQCIWQ